MSITWCFLFLIILIVSSSAENKDDCEDLKIPVIFQDWKELNKAINQAVNKCRIKHNEKLHFYGHQHVRDHKN